MNKYFTPSIEDIHVGYECEIQVRYDVWQPFIFELSPDMRVPASSINIRVPYLSQEQIQKEGWRYEGRVGEYDMHDFKKGITALRWSPQENQISISNIDFSRETTHPLGGENQFFFGRLSCKDINTLRQICKLLI